MWTPVSSRSFERIVVIPQIESSVIRQISEPILRPINEVLQRPTQTPVQESIIKPIQEPVLKPITQPLVKPVVRPVQKPILEAIQEPVQQPISTPTPTNIFQTGITSSNFFITPSYEPPEKLIEEKEGAFKTEVKVGGKFEQANKVPLSWLDAHGLGAYVVDNTPAATFRVSKTQGKPKKSKINFPNYNEAAHKFYRDYRGKNQFIERSFNRIDTAGELQGITMQGLLAISRKRRGFISF